ncbi:portal protein [Tistrella mobilis]|uniref:Phage tail protein n=1 Tax=Tistrella mobilis (strain KA081020-065) TaxID=1110502 RepID=I3TGK4_TISMK|nr:portal protein [Tistrella mobilis]AFK51892.1 hypothetical protein TMO_0053 [Tistrella mobilis KA081020-065]
MAAMDVPTLIKRADRAWERNAAWRSLHQEAYRYALPERDPITTTAEGARKSDAVYDSTAIGSVSRFANRIQDVAFPARQRWATLDAGSDVPEADRDEVQKALDEVEQVLWREVHLSNWDVALNEALHDLSVSTGLILVQSAHALRRNSGAKIQCQAVPAPLAALEEGPFGIVEGVFWKQKVVVRDILRLYPDADLPPELERRRLEDENAEIELETATYYDAEDDGYRFDVLWRGSPPARLVARMHNTMPWICFRWLKAPGEVYGRGPVIQVLPDIKTANAVVRLVLQAASLAIVPAFTAVDDGVLNLNTIQIRPGALIPVGSNGGGRGASLQPLPSVGDVRMSQIVLSDLRQNIKDALFDRQLPPETGPVRSPTEIMERTRELQRDIGAAFGRLISDGAEPAIARFLDILSEAGEVALPLKVNGREIAIKATSPLAQVQNLADVQTVTQYLQILAQIYGPEVVQEAVKRDDFYDWLADKLGVPQKLLPTVTERQKGREDARQGAEAQMLATSPVAARVADNLTKPAPAGAQNKGAA